MAENLPPESAPGPSDTEAESRLNTVDYIQSIREYCLEMDRLWDQRASASTPTVFRRRNVIEAIKNEMVPVSHHRILLTHDISHEAVAGIERVYLRLPTPYYYREGSTEGEADAELDLERRDTPPWKDIFIELIPGVGDERSFYLLNTGGFIRYESGDDLVWDKEDYEFTGNLFLADEDTVPTSDDWDGPQITLGMLHTILREYIQERQGNEPTA